MSITLEQIVLDAKRIANRLKDREPFCDAILNETENINKQIESMREFQDDIELLNNLARERSNMQLITIIHQENPQIREIQQENKQLRSSLEDHQRALELVMAKYREHTQKKILCSKINFNELANSKNNELIKKQSEKIQEMAAVMQRAANLEEDKINVEKVYLTKLVTENKGLRELLEISHRFGSHEHKILKDDKETQTQLEEEKDIVS